MLREKLSLLCTSSVRTSSLSHVHVPRPFARLYCDIASMISREALACDVAFACNIRSYTSPCTLHSKVKAPCTVHFIMGSMVHMQTRQIRMLGDVQRPRWS